MVSMLNQSQKEGIFLYVTYCSIIKLGKSNARLLETGKQQLHVAFIITKALVDFMVGKDENVIR